MSALRRSPCAYPPLMDRIETAEDLLDWLCHPAGRAAKVARLDQLLRAEHEIRLVREVMREVVIELEQVDDDEDVMGRDGR